MNRKSFIATFLAAIGSLFFKPRLKANPAYDLAPWREYEIDGKKIVHYDSVIRLDPVTGQVERVGPNLIEGHPTGRRFDVQVTKSGDDVSIEPVEVPQFIPF